MIADESEPSWCIDFSSFSDSSSSSDTDEYDINNLFQRRTSISLFNVSTPLAINKRYSNQYKSVSHYNIHSERKKRKYKPYLNENKYESKTQESKLQIEHLGMPIHNLNVSGDNISVMYAEALKEIESLKIQINKLKSEYTTTTPVFIRRKSLQSSMIKNLFRNSSTSMRQNHNFATSLFETNSTCMTIDIEDQNSCNDNNDISNEFMTVNSHETKENPFFIKTESPISDRSFNNSKDPLIHHSGKKEKHVNRMRGFVNKFIKCPGFIYKIIHNKQNAAFNNRISPIPKVVIFSPKTSENDSGNDSDVQQIRLEDVNYNTPNVKKVLTDLSKCAAELSEKLSIFQNVLAQSMNQKNIV